MADTVLKGYPQAVGERLFALVDHKGPNPYGTITTNVTPPTGGDTLTAAQCGMKYIDKAVGGLSDDGTYEVHATETLGDQSELTQVKLIWIIATTGAELGSVDVSARTVRFAVWGR